MVFHYEDFSFCVVGSSERTVDVLVFEQSGMRLPVGIDQTVQAEVGVVLELSMVSAVPIHVLSCRCFALVDGVVAPLPDKTAAEGRILLRQVQVFLEVAGAVAHGVAVFHQQKRLVRIIIQIISHFGKSRVHASEQVDVGDVELAVAAQIECALVMCQACGICLFGPPQSPLKGDSVAALISHGPDKNAGAVAVPDDH